MKKILLVFVVLLVAFCGIWIFKAKTPVNRPDDADAVKGDLWWENTNIPQPDPEWVLDPEIPANYIPVPGENELYMVIDDDGKITEYRKRTKQEDGSWLWETINPDIPDNYEPVEGLKDVYKVTDKDGKTSYYKYIRNDDDTFAFIPVDKNGKELQPEKPSEDNSNAIPQNYIRIKGNIYAVYNEHGVCIGYKERRFDEKTEKYYWVDAEKPKEDTPKPTDPTTPSIPVPPIQDPPTTPTNPSNPTNPTAPTNPGDEDNKTLTQTEIITSTEIKGGWVITYETKITRVYTAQGVLLSTKKEGPVEVDRRKLTDDDQNVPDPSKIAATLQKEYARVSVGLAYRDDLAQEVLNIINVERAAAGLPLMRIDAKSNGQLLAHIRAADMAIYNHSDYDSPMYGTLSQLCERFKIETDNTYEALWKTTSSKAAQDIASRLQLMHGDKILLSEYDSIGLSIVSKNGYFYIDFIILE